MEPDVRFCSLCFTHAFIGFSFTDGGTKYGSGFYSKAYKRPKGKIRFYNRTKLYEMKPDWQDKTTVALIKCAVLINHAFSHSNDVAYYFYKIFVNF